MGRERRDARRNHHPRETLPVAKISPSPRTDMKDQARKIISRLKRGISHNVVMDHILKTFSFIILSK